VSFKFSPVDPCCRGNEFWDKIDYNSAPVKDNCTLFAPTPYFQARTIRWCHLNFPLLTPVAMTVNLGTIKIYYNLALMKDNCALFAPTPLIRRC